MPCFLGVCGYSRFNATCNIKCGNVRFKLANSLIHRLNHIVITLLDIESAKFFGGNQTTFHFALRGSHGIHIRRLKFCNHRLILTQYILERVSREIAEFQVESRIELARNATCRKCERDIRQSLLNAIQQNRFTCRQSIRHTLDQQIAHLPTEIINTRFEEFIGAHDITKHIGNIHVFTVHILRRYDAECKRQLIFRFTQQRFDLRNQTIFAHKLISQFFLQIRVNLSTNFDLFQIGIKQFSSGRKSFFCYLYVFNHTREKIDSWSNIKLEQSLSRLLDLSSRESELTPPHQLLHGTITNFGCNQSYDNTHAKRNSSTNGDTTYHGRSESQSKRSTCRATLDCRPNSRYDSVAIEAMLHYMIVDCLDGCTCADCESRNSPILTILCAKRIPHHLTNDERAECGSQAVCYQITVLACFHKFVIKLINKACHNDYRSNRYSHG